MRLLNATTLELSEFYDSEIPDYAILSHTWGNEEVSYQDWCTQAFPNKAGYSKIRNFCKICRLEGYKWAWIDTCCIDKTSSAELSEAINSMYRWYKDKVCYAYLVDVPTSDDVEAEGSAFCLSRWFTRGWTLQELIAPRMVYFYSEDWVKIAEREKYSKVVAGITGIPRKLLMNTWYLRQYSVAQKMSWASKRKTTRTEDIAYCLLGLFDVNMPLLYGEGDNAFIRLQEEIMKISADHTLFAWAGTTTSYMEEWSRNPSLMKGYTTDTCMTGATWFRDMDSGLLAPSPEYFARSSRFVRREIEAFSSSKPYSMTNRGLEIELSLCPPSVLGGNQLAILNCGSKNFPSKNIAIYLVSERDKGGGDEEDSDEEDSDEEDRDEEDRDEEDSNEQDRDEEDSNEQISDEQDSDEEDSDEKFRAWDRAMWYKGNFKRILCHKLEFLEYKDVASSLQTIYIQRESALWDVD